MLSNLAGAGLGFAVSVILARLLDLGAFGRMNLVLSLIVILFTVADFGFSNAVVIYHNRAGTEGALGISVANRAYIRTLAWTFCAGIIAIASLRRVYTLSLLEMVVIAVSFLLLSAYKYLTAIHQAAGDWLRFNALNL